MDSILAYRRNADDDYYNIIGCDETSSVEQILAEYKIRALECHPDKHHNDPESGEKFARLQRAKEALTDPGKRKDYDAWKYSGLAIPYDEWQAKRGAMHTSMHWAVKKQKEPMLEDTPSNAHQSTPPGESPWANSRFDSWSSSDYIRKFRNYEI